MVQSEVSVEMQSEDAAEVAVWRCSLRMQTEDAV